ncbi:hypothetical protein [Zavarzinella formosa]|uniref:hypothetical protein n=1 Tax=Zavarzinella formosa TaxID=360055 RepID=UPI0002EDCFC9|nr:hypothetical protein [Zavarzinella formosa]
MTRLESIRRPHALPVSMLALFLMGFAFWYCWNPAAELVAQPERWKQQNPRDPEYSTDPDDPFPMPPELIGVDLLAQSKEAAAAKGTGCIACHQHTGDPHGKDTLHIGCTDCHGGNPSATDKNLAHVSPKYPEFWPTSANPVRSYTLLNHESPEFIRFVNPGDLRVAHVGCGTTNCHPREVQTNRKQLMATGAMLWGAALYNNGSVPFKRARFGEAYSMKGAPVRMISNPAPEEWEINTKGVVPYLDPLPRFEMSQPGNILRIFEKGGRFRPEVGIPERTEEPGRPRTRLSERGIGTENRTDPVLVSLNKTRLFDPTLNFMGTNDHPGDYRSSGCTACHVVYANDKSPVHSGPYASAGSHGFTQSSDPTIPKNESGHPIQHKFTNSVPTSQCIVCHIHPGTTVMNSYLGYMWWDQETEGKHMYPEKQKYPTNREVAQALQANPEESSVRGNWSNPEFLENITDLNPLMNKTQFASFAGHGWVFRAVFKKDREGTLTDHFGNKIPSVTPRDLAKAVEFPCKAKSFHGTLAAQMDKEEKIPDVKYMVACEAKLNAERAGQPVHLMDIHLEKGMHCVDCHFVQDMHGNNRLHMEVRAGCEIQCIDCHGTASTYATLKTSGPAAYTSAPQNAGRNLAAMKTPFKKPRFETVIDDAGRKRYFQNSMVEKDLRWELVQTKDTIDPTNPRYNEKAALAKTVRFEGDTLAWGDKPEECAHKNKEMHCIACHSSWNPSCYGCHLPQKANQKAPILHGDGEVTRNYTAYNFQTLRDDIYMLARDGDVTGNRIGPARSSCAVHVGSYNNNRESIYVQQQTLSAEGFGGTAFSTNVPHTVRGKGDRETKQCTDCHLSRKQDNNAWMGQLLMQGSNYLNLIGRYAWVGAGEEGLFGVNVTEREEPQAVIGSHLHQLAYPDFFAKHQEHKKQLHTGHEHPGRDIGEAFLRPLQKNEILGLAIRGEYLLAACGEGGVRAFDVAFIDNKAFAERITTAPVSPFGQQFHVPMKYCTAVAVPSTVAVDPTRKRYPENKEGPIAPYFGYIYATDKHEGLVVIGIGTMVDGDPTNNFLKRAKTFNPEGVLDGASTITIVGSYAYIGSESGLVVVSLKDPVNPEVTKVIGHPIIGKPKSIQVQFRYGFVVDEEGIKLLDVTELGNPIPKAVMRIDGLHNIYLARTYAYVAAGKRGLIILDIKNPEKMKIDQVYTAEGEINDLRDVKLGITYNSQFAYLADGHNGMRVVQLTSPETPGNDGFSPRPTPHLIAGFKLPAHGKALCISKGLDRDRAVDEEGNQIGVFGRVGARPFNFDEQRKMYLKGGRPWYVSDDPTDPIYDDRRRKTVVPVK